MKSKLFPQKPSRTKISTERWVRVLPDSGEGYMLYDAIQEICIGRILMDASDNWIYDGQVLTIDEQEDVAGFITGNHKEMNELIRNL